MEGTSTSTVKDKAKGAVAKVNPVNSSNKRWGTAMVVVPVVVSAVLGILQQYAPTWVPLIQVIAEAVGHSSN